MASFLKIVSDYVQRYRGTGLSSRGRNRRRYRERRQNLHACAFSAPPIMPYGARLYTRQIIQAAFSGNVPATFRLSLLPPLASAAAVAFKITGSDKGVW